MAPYLYLTSSFITDSTSFCSISSFISLYGITLPAIPTGRFLGETMKGSVSSSLLPKLFAARIRRISSISHLDRYALNAGNPCSGATSIAILFISTICLFRATSIEVGSLLTDDAASTSFLYHVDDNASSISSASLIELSLTISSFVRKSLFILRYWFIIILL